MSIARNLYLASERCLRPSWCWGFCREPVVGGTVSIAAQGSASQALDCRAPLSKSRSRMMQNRPYRHQLTYLVETSREVRLTSKRWTYQLRGPSAVYAKLLSTSEEQGIPLLGSWGPSDLTNCSRDFANR